MARTDYLLELTEDGAIDLGEGFRACLYQQAEVDPAGFYLVHPAGGTGHIPAGEPCLAAVVFDTWTLVSLDPLHVEPSILCSCGRHGYVRAGRWEEA